MSRRKAPKAPPPPEPWKHELTTYANPMIELQSFDTGPRSAPYCHNGSVGVRQHRVTVELVDEPIEVIRERIRTLWSLAYSHLDESALRREAERYGLDLSGIPLGSARTKP